jgi:hypothetical protein
LEQLNIPFFGMERFCKSVSINWEIPRGNIAQRKMG